MSFIITGDDVNSPMCRELRIQNQGKALELEQLDAMLLFKATDAYIVRDSDDENNGNRPYLALIGRPSGIRADFPFDVKGIDFEAGSTASCLTTYRYDFTRENLMDLVSKGMFEQGFEVPDIIRTSMFELPCRVKCLAIGPTAPNDIPVVFTGLDREHMRCDDTTSGYEISVYFEAVKRKEYVIPEPAPQPKSLYELTAEEVHGAIRRDIPELGHDVNEPLPEQDYTSDGPGGAGMADAQPDGQDGPGRDAAKPGGFGPESVPRSLPEPERDSTELPDVAGGPGGAEHEGPDLPDDDDDSIFY